MQEGGLSAGILPCTPLQTQVRQQARLSSVTVNEGHEWNLPFGLLSSSQLWRNLFLRERYGSSQSRRHRCSTVYTLHTCIVYICAWFVAGFNGEIQLRMFIVE